MQYEVTSKEHFITCLDSGYVRGLVNDIFIVSTENDMLKSRVAVSCLVRPHKGDKVLLCKEESEVYILSVLERGIRADLATDIVIDGQLNMQAESINISSRDDLNLGANACLHLTGEKLSAHATDCETVFDSCQVRGRILRSSFKKVEQMARSVEQVFSSLVQRLKNNLRYVQEHEEVQAGSSRYLTEQTLTMHSKNAVHMAEEVVTINGEQVHLG